VVSHEFRAVGMARSVMASGLLGCGVVALRWKVNASIFSRDMLGRDRGREGMAEGERVDILTRYVGQ
jgi:hypothetical protein